VTLLETLRCEEGAALHLSYHQERIDRTLSALGITEQIELRSLISPPLTGTFRCRFLYGEGDPRIEYHPYTLRIPRSLKLVTSSITYPFKYADRTGLNELYEKRGTCDDVLISENGFLKDTTIANIALWIDGEWLTPDQPLLAGTARARLIDEGVLTPAALRIESITQADKIAVMNALTGLVEVENGIIFD